MAFIKTSRKVPRKSKQNVAIQVRRQLLRNAEHKCFIGTAGAQALATAGTCWALTQGVVQGDSVVTRDGSQITLLDVGLKVDAHLPSAGATAVGVRVILFYDKMNLGTLPAVTELLNVSSLTSPYSVSQILTNRFVVLADQVHNITVGGIQQTLFNFQRRLSHKVTYNGTADAAASNGKGAVFMIALTDNSVPGPVYDFAYHIHYLDM